MESLQKIIYLKRDGGGCFKNPTPRLKIPRGDYALVPLRRAYKWRLAMDLQTTQGFPVDSLSGFTIEAKHPSLDRVEWKEDGTENTPPKED